MHGDGIELSPEMVDRLRSKPGGADLRVEIGDMSSVHLGGTYSLVYLVYNTVFNLLTEDDQVRCFENAARHLDDDGAFVVEAALPHAWIRHGVADFVHTEFVEADSVGFDVARYDPMTQLLAENHVSITAGGVRFQPIVCRLNGAAAGSHQVSRRGGRPQRPVHHADRGPALAHASPARAAEPRARRRPMT